jgi:hypothetical protein
MKRLAAIFALSFCCLILSLPLSAGTTHSKYKEDPAAIKFQKKQEKAMKKQLKKEKKYQDKMYRESQKKSTYHPWTKEGKTSSKKPHSSAY